jgi:hypothetical protein
VLKFYTFDRLDGFVLISNLVWEGMASVTDLYISLQGQRVRESERVTEREREKTSKTRGDYASTIWE